MNPETEIQIRDCESRLRAAMLASNVVELDALLADDLVFVGPTGELATKAMDLELHRGGASQFRAIEIQETEIRVWSADFSLVCAKVFISGTFSGAEFAGNCRYTRVWRRGENGWQIVGGGVCAMS